MHTAFFRDFSSKRISRFLRIILFILCLANSLEAQTDIPINTWRMHLSYDNMHSVAISNNEVYAATEIGVLVFNKQDNSLTTYTKVTGLTSAGITDIEYDESGKQLMIAYEDGNIDLIQENTVINFSRLKDLNEIVGSKKINHIAIHNSFAYLSTDYGVVVFDLDNREVKETWRDLGTQGKNLSIVKSIIYNDSIALATHEGILVGSLNDNLLDYNNWKRFDTGDLKDTVESIGYFNNNIYAALNNKGLYQCRNGNFVTANLLVNATFRSLEGSPQSLTIVADENLWSLNTEGQLIQIADDAIVSPVHAVADNNGTFWIADSKNGMVSNVGGDFNSYLPNGPTTQNAFRLKFNNSKIYALPGGFTQSGLLQNNNGDINIFEDGVWRSLNVSSTDITDAVSFNNNLFISSFGDGLLQLAPDGSVVIYDETNSPLENLKPEGKAVYVTTLKNSNLGLWVANYGSDRPLHLLKNDNTWQSFSFNYALAKHPLNLEVDLFNNVWMSIDPLQGGGIIVLDPETGVNTWISDVTGSGALPNKSVRSLALDRDGNMWVGTDAGVSYFFSDMEDAIKPIFENRFLLKDEKINSIAIDGGNRKWIGTESGAWLFNPTGELMVNHFTIDNSPLPSNKINDIEINHDTGEIFFSTDKGIASYRGDATSSDLKFNDVKIFPNPVTSNFSGTVGINGLATDAIVKITDVSGKLVFQGRANGGTATWNVQDSKGRRPHTGVYLVFASSDDGSESMVGKIAVIE